MTEAVFIQVGGGRVRLPSYVLLYSFTCWKLRFFLEEIFLLLFRQPCFQFSLQATHPLKDYSVTFCLKKGFCNQLAAVALEIDHVFYADYGHEFITKIALTQIVVKA